ncbi:CPBP family intramembrane glutamic endopeptidase [endosymbiont GvMRE of Glomus versiforme]|uniref:CPBP family intramembrane glutamic endopeptidase n=1 Tax=endosymbiont GvMRE of Glomus versiforme TaxID=2039283 RepID=UPI000ECB48DD|nr:CPBP family intramembrane glutamic endopeptidase [endosymbiont GvMRE of Glomus versiforme]RHZ36972.1 hypothetical protein GvMRE_I2g310 [endosymbiont GvMRE of Glomus versiforme]
MENWEKVKELAERYFYPLRKWWWITILIVYWAFRCQGKQIWLSLRKEKKQIFRQTGIFLLVMALIHFFIKWLLSFSHLPLRAKLIEKLVQLITEAKGFLGLLPIILASCVIAPIIEECLYRFFIFKILGKNNPFSYLLSYFTFILAHWQVRGENFVSLFVQYSVATVGFIWIYKKSNWNLAYPIILHSLVNILFIGIVLISPNFPLF